MKNELIRSNDKLGIYDHPINHQTTFLSAENMADYNQYFDNAIQAVSEDSALLMHVKLCRLPLQYAAIQISGNNIFESRGWYKKQQGVYSVKPGMMQTLEEFYKVCRQAKIVRLNESGLSPEDFYEGTRRFNDLQVTGNKAFGKKVIAGPLPTPDFSNGNLEILTNGVRGGNDYKVQWLGWQGEDVNLLLDLGNETDATTIELSSLWDAKNWALHPVSVTCFVSADGKAFNPVGSQGTNGDQQHEPMAKLYKFNVPPGKIRFVKFTVKGTIHLFDWHPSAGGRSWFFLDEIVVR